MKPQLRVRWQAFYQPKMIEILEASGTQFGFTQPFNPEVPRNSRHLMGGLRMSSDTRTSVCDAFGRSHDVENLYDAEGSQLDPESEADDHRPGAADGGAYRIGVASGHPSTNSFKECPRPSALEG